MNRSLAVLAAGALVGYLIADYWGLLAAAGLIILQQSRPRLARLVPVVVAVAMAAAVVLQGSFDRRGVFPLERPVAHTLGLLLALLLGMVLVGEASFSLRGPVVDELLSETEPGQRAAGRVMRGATWSLAGTALVSVGGFAFWVLAARISGPDALGGAAALFSASFFIAYATSLGLPTTVTREATDLSRRSAVITGWSLLLTVVSSTIGAAVLVLLVPVEDTLPIGGRSVAGAAVLALVISGVSVSTVVDARLAALLRWRAYFFRLAAVTVLRFAGVVFIPDADSAAWLFVAAVWAFAATSLALLPSVLRRDPVDPRPVFRSDVRRLAKFATVNYVSQLAVQAPLFVVPLVVLVATDHTAYGRFYLVWGIASVFLMATQVIGQTLLAESANRGRSRSGTLTALGLGLALTSSAALLALLVGNELTSLLFGQRYQDAGHLLGGLLVGCVAAVPVVIEIAEARSDAALGAVLAASIPYAVFTLVGVAAGAQRNGVDGAVWGWVVGSALSLAPATFLLVRRMGRVPADGSASPSVDLLADAEPSGHPTG